MAVLLGAAACESSSSRRPRPAPQPPPPAAGPPALMGGFQLLPTAFGDLPEWQRDQQGEALAAFQRSCVKLNARSSGSSMGGGGPFGWIGHWQEACAAASRIRGDNQRARVFFEQWFIPYRVESAGSDEGLFTGYYEPVLNGSWSPSTRYHVPLYRPTGPKGTKLPSRSQIVSGALSGRGLELVWVDDPIAAFFLQIQGSGRVQLPDGQMLRLGYAGQNGHSYFPIGRELLRRGEIAPEQMSMQAIRAWLLAHPEEAPALMNLNPSYVFFRILEGDGPVGAQGVALTPGRSLAVDPSFVPYGVPIWLDTTDPLQGGAPLRRLVIAQDTGGAIKGPIRGDVFWGLGDEAEARAGLMKQPGRYYLLLPRAAAALS
jgi:membrane-bound lytic murein transglycosylase A